MNKIIAPAPFCLPEPVGIVVAEFKDLYGRVIDRRITHNFVTVDGVKLIADQLAFSPSLAAPRWLAVGTGAAQTRDDTTLTTEIDRKALNSGYPIVEASPNDNILTFAADFGSGDAIGVLTEAAVFNATPTGGNMLNYFVFAPGRDKQSGETLTVTLQMRLGAL